jgi:hypothetical protein
VSLSSKEAGSFVCSRSGEVCILLYNAFEKLHKKVKGSVECVSVVR